MTSFLNRVLKTVERQLPEADHMWISDLRAEAQHIHGTFARQLFLSSGVLAAIGQILRARFGVQRVGQTLLGLALLMLCLGGLVIAKGMSDDIVKTTFYCALILYTVAGSLVFLDLRLTRRFTFGCCLILMTICSGLSLNLFPELSVHFEFLRAFALEAAFMMGGLFIAASYLGWVGKADHA